MFDLRLQAKAHNRASRAGIVAIVAVGVWFFALGAYLVAYGTVHEDVLALIPGYSGLGVGVLFIVLSVVVFREAVEARVWRDGVTFVPNRGRPVHIRWSDPRIHLSVIDRSSNRFVSATQRGSLFVDGPGQFAKQVSNDCVQAIYESARSAGLSVTTRDELVGTKYEARRTVIRRAS